MKLIITAVLMLASMVASAIPASKILNVAKPRVVTIRAGGSAIAVITVTVDPELHLQANPASRPGLIPTALTVTAAHGIKSGRPVYPEGRPYHLPGEVGGEILTYQGTFEIRVPLTAAPGAKKARVELRGDLAFQACNDKTCYPPDHLTLILPVVVTR